MNLKRRVQALELAVAPSDSCEACGYYPGAPMELTLSFGDEPVEGPDVCPGCGRPLILRLSFDNPRDGRSPLASAPPADRLT